MSGECRWYYVLAWGAGLGNHVGDEPLAIQCDEFGRRRQRAVVVAAGNAANQRRHYQKRGMEEGAVESIELSVGSNLAGFQMEIWTMVPEIYELSIVSPTGERFPKTVVRPGERQEYVFLFEKTKINGRICHCGNQKQHAADHAAV